MFARTFVTEGEANSLCSGLTFSSFALFPYWAFVLATAFSTEVAAATLVVAADLLTDVASVTRLTSIIPVEALTTLTTFSGGWDGFSFGVLELAIFAKAARAVVAERPAYFYFVGAHLKVLVSF